MYKRQAIQKAARSSYRLPKTVNDSVNQVLSISITLSLIHIYPDNLPTSNEIAELQTSYNNMLSAIIDLLDGAKYLWEGDAHNEQ